jgi:hypothetical protein
MRTSTTAHDEAPACAVTRAGAWCHSLAAQEGTTIMSEATVAHAQPVPAPRHPDWCDPHCCERTESDVNHTSRPVELATCDARFSLALVRADEDDFPAQRSAPPELALTVEPTTVVGDPVLVYLGADELPGLIDALRAHEYLARLWSCR